MSDGREKLITERRALAALAVGAWRAIPRNMVSALLMLGAVVAFLSMRDLAGYGHASMQDSIFLMMVAGACPILVEPFIWRRLLNPSVAAEIANGPRISGEVPVDPREVAKMLRWIDGCRIFGCACFLALASLSPPSNILRDADVAEQADAPMAVLIEKANASGAELGNIAKERLFVEALHDLPREGPVAAQTAAYRLKQAWSPERSAAARSAAVAAGDWLALIIITSMAIVMAATCATLTLAQPGQGSAAQRARAVAKNVVREILAAKEHIEIGLANAAAIGAKEEDALRREAKKKSTEAQIDRGGNRV